MIVCGQGGETCVPLPPFPTDPPKYRTAPFPPHHFRVLPLLTAKEAHLGVPVGAVPGVQASKPQRQTLLLSSPLSETQRCGRDQTADGPQGNNR